VSLTGNPEKFETYVDSLEIWFSISVYSTEREYFIAVFDNVTERKGAQEAVKSSERMMRGILAASPVGINLSQGREVQWVNDAWLRMFGFEDDRECVGQNARILYRSQEEYERVGALLHGKLATGEVTEADAEFKRKDGSIFCGLIRVKALDPSDPAGQVIVAISDISDRKQAEDSLSESEQRLELALWGADLGLYDWYVQSGKAVANQRSAEIVGYSLDEIEQSFDFWRSLLDPEDVPRVLENVSNYLKGLTDYYEDEYRVRTKSDEWKWIHSRGKVVERDKDGRAVRMTGTYLDISERKRAEQALIDNEARYRALFENMRNGVAIYEAVDNGKDFVLVDFNKAAETITGSSRDQVIGKRVSVVFPGVKEFGLFEVLQRTWQTGEPAHHTVNEYRDEKIEIWVDNFVYKLPSSEIVAVFSDETERKLAEEALRESEEKYRLVVDNAQEAIFVAQDGMLQFVNPKTVELLAYSEEELLSKPLTEFIHQNDRETVLERHLRRLKGEVFPSRYSFRILRKDGTAKWVEIESTVISWEGRPAALAFMTDITERLRMQEALAESEEWYRTLVEESFDGVFVQKGFKIIFASLRLHQMLGYSAGELEGLDHRVVYHPDYQEITRERATARMRGEEVVSQYEVKLQRKDGTSVEWEISAKEVKVKGEPGVQVWVRDISKPKRYEEVQRRLATAVEQAAEAIVITDTKGDIQYVNPAFETITGYTREEVLGRNPGVLKSGEHDQKFYQNLWDTIKRGDVWTGRFINRKKDGKLYHEEATISPVRDSSGTIINFVAVKRDVTEHIRLSAQLVQAQKMEAVGTLAGGIAHDFNNLLQVTLGYSELLLAERQEDDPEYADLSRILQAAKNGAELVQRLLTFSRKVEPKPIPLDLNRRIVQVEKLLKRTIPKMIDIQTHLSDDLAEINADPIQMEQVLMNLAVNARDAMPDGGNLILETRNVTLDDEYCKLHVGAGPGDYVLLTVSDTGHGMDKTTVEHIFEPFYTTKKLGRGTGLGLAMVYGIVRQHEGFITCYSEVGTGTTFNVYFPAIERHLEPAVEMTGVMPAFGTETILLVDDEAFVRDLGQRILSKAGYTVLTAANGIEALDLFTRKEKQIDLVILDLIMPEMGGEASLKELLKIDPGVKVLVASGYSADASMRGPLELGAKGFVGKPFRLKELLGQVRKVLDES